MKAFPQLDTRCYEPLMDKGMDLRDYFAAKAMLGLMSRVDHVNGDCVTNATADDVAKYSYSIADAMMKARES